MFQIVATDQPVRLTDPMHIRALAHPARLAVIEELYQGRELTATECAEIAGLSPSAMSYHLRSLERAGIVVRAEHAGDGRERPWRAAGTHLQVDADAGPAESVALGATLVARLESQYNDWVRRRSSESKLWRDTAILTNGTVWLRPEELQELDETIDAVLIRHRERRSGKRPADARRVRLSVFAFPIDASDD